MDLSMVLKTKVINESTQDIIWKQGISDATAEVISDSKRLRPGEELTIKVDRRATYRELDVRDVKGRQIGIGSDDFEESEEIILYETPDQEIRWRTSKPREAPRTHHIFKQPSRNLQDVVAFDALRNNASSRIGAIETSCEALRVLLNQAKICPAQCQDLVRTCLEGTNKMIKIYSAVTENDMWQLYLSKKLRQLIGSLNRLLCTLGSVQDLLQVCGSQWGSMGLALSISTTTVSKFDLLINELRWNLDTVYYALQLANEVEFKWNENTCRYLLQKKNPNPSLITRMTGLIDMFVTRHAPPQEMELEKSEKLARESLVRKDRELFSSVLQKESILTTESFDSDLAREQTNLGYLASILEKRLQLERFQLEETSVLSKSRPILEYFRINHLDLKIRKNKKKLGKGGFKSIYKGEWCGQAVAIGVTKECRVEHITKEALVMLKVQHPNVVDFLGWGFVDAPRTSDAQLPVHSEVFRPLAGYIVMELMQGDLWHMVEQLTRSESGSPFPMAIAVDILLQIAQAMVHMHNLGFMHRDLKAANCLVNLSPPLEQAITANWGSGRREVESYTVKVIDFGSSKWMGADDAIHEHTANTGTRRWMAPEVWGRTLVPYRRSADVYSFGMVCYEVVTGLQPFDGFDNNTQIKQALDKGIRPSLPASVSCPEGLKQLMSKCWAHKESARPDFKNVVKELWTIKTELELQ